MSIFKKIRDIFYSSKEEDDAKYEFPAPEEEKWWAFASTVDVAASPTCQLNPQHTNRRTNYNNALAAARAAGQPLPAAPEFMDDLNFNGVEAPFVRVTRLLVRRAYYFVAPYLLRRFGRFSNRTNFEFVITGTSGIGKSCFGTYLLYSFSHWFMNGCNSTLMLGLAPAPHPLHLPQGGYLRHLRIIYAWHATDDYQDAEYLLFEAKLPETVPFGPSAAQHIQWTSRKLRASAITSFCHPVLQPILEDPTTIFLHDGGQVHAYSLKCFSVWLTSAKKEGISKACRRRRALRQAISLPPYSLHDMLTLRELCFANYLSERLVMRLFDFYGGSVRYVLSEPCDLVRDGGGSASDEPSELMLAPLKDAVVSSNLKQMLEYIGDVVQKVPEKISFKLLHIFPVDTNHANEQTAYRRTYVSFASSFVAAEIATRMAKIAKHDLFQFFATCKDVDLFAAAFGRLFEGYAQHCLCEVIQPAATLLVPNPARVAPRFFIRNLSVPGSLSVQGHFPLPAGIPSTSPSRPTYIFDSDAQIRLIPDGVYGRPSDRFFPSIDGLIRPNILLQMTIAEKHPIKVKGLRRVHEQLQQGSYHLYFVVPCNRFPGFTAQNYQIRRNVYSTNHGLVHQGSPVIITQWVLRIPIQAHPILGAAGAPPLLPGPLPALPPAAAGAAGPLVPAAVQPLSIQIPPLSAQMLLAPIPAARASLKRSLSF